MKKVILTDNAGKYIVPFLEEGRELLIVSPWIGGKGIEVLRSLSKGRKVTVITGTDSNPFIREFSTVRPSLLFFIANFTFAGLLIYTYLTYVQLLPLIAVITVFLLLLLPCTLKVTLKGNTYIVENLHAKVYATERGSIVSSANFTTSGLFKNVEVVVFTNTTGEQIISNLRNMLQRYDRCTSIISLFLGRDK